MLKNNESKIVLMSCCAPCSAGAITELKGQGADFCVLFYNPNIFPFAEYQKRLNEQIKFCESIGVKYFVSEWEHEKWLECVSGLENEPERGSRCTECFRHRFAFGIKWAVDNGYNTVASVFGVSKHKDQSQVDDAAKTEIEKSGLNIVYLPINWDENLRCEIGKNTGFYRQNYCGCEFSIRKV